eukprot:Skav212832  [mRNA]  locus=scaffold2466:205432:206178:+ [translate_table: standard]
MAPKKFVRDVEEEEEDVVQDPTAASSTDVSIEVLAERLLNMDLDEMEKYEGKFKEIAKDALTKMKMVHDKSRDLKKEASKEQTKAKAKSKAEDEKKRRQEERDADADIHLRRGGQITTINIKLGKTIGLLRQMLGQQLCMTRKATSNIRIRVPGFGGDVLTEHPRRTLLKSGCRGGTMLEWDIVAPNSGFGNASSSNAEGYGTIPLPTPMDIDDVISSVLSDEDGNSTDAPDDAEASDDDGKSERENV